LSIFDRTPGTALMVSPQAAPEPVLATIPEPVAEQGLSVEQLLAIVRAYWMQIIVITAVAGCLATVGFKYIPKTYTATTTLIVDSNTKDPLAGRDIPADFITSYVQTQMELMVSSVVLVPVIHKLGLLRDGEFGGSNGNSELIEANVQKRLAAGIDVKRGTGGQLLYVSASARSATKAAAIANAVADIYIDEDQRRLNGPAAERAERYSQELADLREKVSAAQQKVTAFGRESGVGDLGTASTGLDVQTLDSLHEHLLATQNYRRSLEAHQSPQSSGATSAAQTTQATLDTELWQLNQLQTTYGPQHPKVKDLESQIALTRQTLASQSRALSANEGAELAQARDLEKKYLQDIATQQAKVATVRQAQADGGKLLLELQSAQATYKQALEGYDQVMFQAVANHTNVNIISRAVPPLEPSKPNKLKLTAVAVVGALGAGVAFPLGYGLFLARRLRCRDDMERDFGIAVLAQLAEVPSLARAT
jgi:polysaccharide biosynthesis transport protein